MQGLFDQIRRYAPHLRTALVSGETGTGKELVARALHAVGPRRGKPFVTVDCTTSADPAFEATLFGLPAAPGTEARVGAFEAADGGVVFLDEIGNLPTAVQARLLRVIEMGELHRVGLASDQRLDVVVIASTNRDLRADVAAGRFRSDLLYRLNNVELVIPPLREHRDDVPYLTAAFLRETADRLGKPLRGLTTNAEAMLASAPWEGNARELRNVIERACMLADGPTVTEQDVLACLPPLLDQRPTALVTTDDGRTLSTVEREHIMKALQRVGGNKKAAARMLGVSRRALYRRLERLELGATIARRRRGAAVNGASLGHDSDGADRRADHLMSGWRAAARK
jgi:DNA-binding NtrC family response regulator